MTVALPTEFFTPASILTLTGAATGVYVVCGALQRAFDFSPRWLAFVLAQVFAFIGAYATEGAGIEHYLFALVNGCLIYCTAVGVNTTLAPSPPPPQTGAAIAQQKGAFPGPRRGFTTRW